MIIRRITHDDLLAVHELWSICYLSISYIDDVRKKLNEDAHTPYGYGAFLESGELISAVLGNPFEMYYGCQRSSLCGIGGVVTHPTHRRMGAVRTLMKTILNEQFSLGTVFSGLYPFNYGFYRKFGYELSASQTKTIFPLSQLSGFAGAFDVRAFGVDDDVTVLLPVFDAFAQRYPLAIVRTPDAFRERLRPNPFAGNTYLYAVYESERPVAYVRFRKEIFEEENLLAVDDCAFMEPRHLRALLGFLSVFQAEFANIRISLPADINLPALLPDPYSVKTSLNHRYMMRVVNCEKALALLTLTAEDAFVIRVEDDFLPQNSGTWRVTATGIQKCDALPDVRMSIEAFSQMFCGFVSYETALLRADVELGRENPSLKRAFPARPSFVGTDY